MIMLLWSFFPFILPALLDDLSSHPLGPDQPVLLAFFFRHQGSACKPQDLVFLVLTLNIEPHHQFLQLSHRDRPDLGSPERAEVDPESVQRLDGFGFPSRFSLAVDVVIGPADLAHLALVLAFFPALSLDLIDLFPHPTLSVNFFV